MENKINWQSFGLGIIGLTIIGAITWGLLYEIGKAPWQFITILIALFGAVITFAGNLNIQIRNEQKPKKVEIYEKVINFFFDSIFAQKLGHEPKKTEETVKSLVEMTPDLILWASDDVLNLYIQFRNMAQENSQNSSNDPNNLIFLFGKILIAMRKDLGHNNKQIDNTSILSTFVNDISNLSLVNSENKK